MSHLSTSDDRIRLERLFEHLKPTLSLVCSDNVLRDIAYVAEFSEMELGTRLNLSSSDVANIDQRDKGYERKYQVFITWKRRVGNGATYSALIKALARCLPFDMNLFETMKSAIEAEVKASLSVDEADSRCSVGISQVVPLPHSALTCAATAALVTSIASQYSMSDILLAKEKECQILRAKVKEDEEVICQLRMSNAVLQERMQKEDSQSKETIRELEVEIKRLHDGLPLLHYQTQSTASFCATTSLHTSFGVPVQATASLVSNNMVDSVVPKIEQDSLASGDGNCSAGTTRSESPVKDRGPSVTSNNTRDQLQSLSVEESMSPPHTIEEESLYSFTADQECSSIVSPIDPGGQELHRNEHSLIIGNAFLAVDESALMEWPARQGRKRSLSPDASPSRAKILLT